MASSMSSQCAFCIVPSSRIVEANENAVLILDGFPVSKGHSLVIPRRHVSSFFETTEAERAAILALIDRAKSLIEQVHKPDAYNIGINDGIAAGQTIPHMHVHVIPRYAGDRADPRGGVRWVIPEKADYWSKR
jgi:diadenosine tetraphosphate (Ap4A) HIT family hydrolase